MKFLKFALLAGIILLSAQLINAQTTIVNIPIITEKGDGTVIEILVFDPIEKDSTWTNINETYLEYDLGWYATGKMNIKVRKHDIYYFRFRRGSKKLNCYDYTYLTIYGGDKKSKIKHTKNNKIVFIVDGTDEVYGSPTEENPIIDPSALGSRE